MKQLLKLHYPATALAELYSEDEQLYRHQWESPLISLRNSLHFLARRCCLTIRKHGRRDPKVKWIRMAGINTSQAIC
jgi:hypothetical protein